MVNLAYCPTNLLLFDILLLHYYINLRSSMIFRPFSGDISLSLDISLGISLSLSFVTVSKLFCCEFLEAFVILLAILLPIKSSVGSALF